MSKSSNPVIFKRKALFPISVDNAGFTTELIASALDCLPKGYDEIVFLIADELHLYNKASVVQNGTELARTLDLFFKKNNYFDEKKRWLERVRNRYINGAQNAVWTYANIRSFTDQHFYPILRNVVLAYETIPQFRRDVLMSARDHYGTATKADPEMSVRLSEFYILEEIAINIRVRLIDKVYDEFYAFKYLKPLVNLYSGFYQISVFELAGISGHVADFSFYEFTESQTPKWTKMVV